MVTRAQHSLGGGRKDNGLSLPHTAHCRAPWHQACLDWYWRVGLALWPQPCSGHLCPEVPPALYPLPPGPLMCSTAPLSRRPQTPIVTKGTYLADSIRNPYLWRTHEFKVMQKLWHIGTQRPHVSQKLMKDYLHSLLLPVILHNTWLYNVLWKEFHLKSSKLYT